MSPRGPEFEHALCNQVAIVVGYIELLLDEVPADSPLRADLLEMHKAARTAMAMLQDGDGGE
jgi:hypothetical protein